jgi:hypothetical protein
MQNANAVLSFLSFAIRFHFVSIALLSYSFFFSPLFETMDNNGLGSLLEIIPSSLLKPGQVARWTETGVAPTCKLLRKPTSLQELKDYKHCFAILCDNDAMIYVKPRGSHMLPFVTGDRSVFFRFSKDVVHIAGPNDAAVAQTVAYLMEVEEDVTKSYSFEVGCPGGNTFDFRAAGTQCLARLCKLASSHEVTFETCCSARSSPWCLQHVVMQ